MVRRSRNVRTRPLIQLGDLALEEAHRGDGGEDQRAAKELKTGHRFAKQDPGENGG